MLLGVKGAEGDHFHFSHYTSKAGLLQPQSLVLEIDLA